MPLIPYRRDDATAYARKWALSRNPEYYDYDAVGGDCTNFASQCLYAGSGVMNYTPTFGWYYIDANHKAPSWTGVIYLYNFLTRRSGIGPVGTEVPMNRVMPGDISQFAESVLFSHSQVVVSVGSPPALDNILICAHTDDSYLRPLSTYHFQRIRFIHIEGVRI